MKIVFFIVSFVVSVSCCYPSSPKEVPEAKELVAKPNVANNNEKVKIPKTEDKISSMKSMDVMKRVGISMKLEDLKAKLGKFQNKICNLNFHAKNNISSVCISNDSNICILAPKMIEKMEKVNFLFFFLPFYRKIESCKNERKSR